MHQQECNLAIAFPRSQHSETFGYQRILFTLSHVINATSTLAAYSAYFFQLAEHLPEKILTTLIVLTNMPHPLIFPLAFAKDLSGISKQKIPPLTVPSYNFASPRF